MKKCIAPKLAPVIFTAFAMISSLAHAQEVQVAVLDSGVDQSAGYNLAPGFNYFLNIEDTSDVSENEGEGHGTVSTRLIAESFSGKIAPFVITDGAKVHNFETTVRIARDAALSNILNKPEIKVVAMTWGTRGITSTSTNLVTQLANGGRVIAIMAGNDVAAEPNVLSLSNYKLPEVIIVGGTDANGNLLPATNRAGAAADKYVTAIGLPNLSADSGGSSWATARIAGIAGAVFLQNPKLTAAEVVEVILKSAEDRGAVGTDNVYGRGFILNADQVLKNVIGPVVIPTTPGTDDSGRGSGGGGAGVALLLGGAVAGALLLSRKPKAKLEKTLILDSYGRAFEVDLGSQIEVNDQVIGLHQFFHGLKQDTVMSGVYLPELSTGVSFAAITSTDPRVDMYEYFASENDPAFADRDAQFAVALSSQLTETVAFDAGFKVNPAQTFGAVSQLTSHELFGTSSFITGQAFSSVLSGFSSQSEVAAMSYSPKQLDNASFKMGLVTNKPEYDYDQDSFSTLFEGSYQFEDNAGLSLQVGQLEEKGSLLGGSSGGIFGVDYANTYAINLAATVKATDKVSFVANYGVARTKVDAAENSLLKDFSKMTSDWYSAGVIGNNLWRKQDQFGFSVSQPLKIRSGAVNYSIPNGRDFSGDILFDRERVNLSETGATETAYEAYYRTMVGEHIELGGFLSYRQNPNHIADYGDEHLAMFTMRFVH